MPLRATGGLHVIFVLNLNESSEKIKFDAYLLFRSCSVLTRVRQRKSSIKPPGAHLISGPKRGGLIREGGGGGGGGAHVKSYIFDEDDNNFPNLLLKRHLHLPDGNQG